MPTDDNHIKEIGFDCSALDLYVWIARKHYFAQQQAKTGNYEPKVINCDFLFQQFGAEYSRKRDFLKDLRKKDQKIRAIYSHKSPLSKKGYTIYPCDPPILEKDFKEIDKKEKQELLLKY